MWGEQDIGPKNKTKTRPMPTVDSLPLCNILLGSCNIHCVGNSNLLLFL